MAKVKKTSCCCGATKSNPCACMKKGVMKCSSKEPKCACYKAKDLKKSFDIAWSVVKTLQCNGREHIQLIEKDGVLMTDCECEKGCLPTRMTPA